jgi:hypothetical protein
MLTVFLIVLPALLMPGVDLGIGRAVVGAGEGGGPEWTDADGARNPLLGVGVEGDLVGDPMPPVLFRVLGMGRTGREVFAGPIEGRGFGKAVDMTARPMLSGGKLDKKCLVNHAPMNPIEMVQQALVYRSPTCSNPETILTRPMVVSRVP